MLFGCSTIDSLNPDIKAVKTKYTCAQIEQAKFMNENMFSGVMSSDTMLKESCYKTCGTPELYSSNGCKDEWFYCYCKKTEQELIVQQNQNSGNCDTDVSCFSNNIKNCRIGANIAVGVKEVNMSGRMLYEGSNIVKNFNQGLIEATIKERDLLGFCKVEYTIKLAQTYTTNELYNTSTLHQEVRRRNPEEWICRIYENPYPSIVCNKYKDK